MTNYEYYKEQIERITRLGITFGIEKATGEVGYCTCIVCEDCKFFGGCSDKKVKWADEEYQEPPVDWNEVPIDTPVFVRWEEGGHWHEAYFAGLKGDAPTVWCQGRTSWTAKNLMALPKKSKPEDIKLAENIKS